MTRTAASRLPPVPPERLTDEQRRAVNEVMRGPRGSFGGPFVPLLRSPELMERVQKLGTFIRYYSSVPLRLREWAILVTAQHWRQPSTWHGHAPLAKEHGVDPAALADLAAGKLPKAMKEDERIIYDFCIELHRKHAVTDKTYAKALALLGEGGVVELTALCGYYVLISMVLNVARTPLPAELEDPFA